MSAWLRSVRDHCLAPERVDAAIYGGRYRPLFEDLPPLRVDEHALHALGRPGGPCDLGVEFVDDTDSDVSAVWPFFGQFIAHDITADRSPLRHRAVGGPAIYNLRVPKANLEGVYGTGPVGSRVLPVGRPRVVAHAAGPARRRLRPRRHPGPDPLRGRDSPMDVFPAWRRAQLEVDRHAREAPISPSVLRTTGFLRPALAERVTEWFTATPTAPTEAVRRSYRALERETVRLFEIARRGLGVRVRHVRAESDPYGSAAELCAELREHGSMSLRTIACDEPHPLLGGAEGGGVDQLRVAHDVFGHAALGVGFDLQSEFATWLQCRTLFSDAARPAAFCELVGAVTAYVMTGEKPALRAKVPPVELLTACDVSSARRGRASRGAPSGS